jgi:hypothetical protein
MLYELLMDANAPEATWQIGLIDTEKLKKHGYDLNLDGKNGHLDPLCEIAPSSLAA